MEENGENNFSSKEEETRNQEGDMGEECSSSSKKIYKVYPMRWYILILIFWLNVSSGMVWISFAPVAVASTIYYQISLTAVNMLSLVFLISYIPFGYLSQWILDHIGLRVTIIIGGSTNLIGSWIRYLSCFSQNQVTRVALVFLGQILASVAQPFLLNAPPKMASYWFSPKGRGTADMVGTMGGLIGIAIGQVISPLLTIYNPPSTATNTTLVNSTFYSKLANNTSPTTTDTDLSTMLLVMAIVGTPPAILAIWIQNKPKTPPTNATAEIETIPFHHSLFQLVHIPQYWIIMFSFGIGVGAFQALTTILEELLQPYGYSDDDAGLMGAVLVVAGIISAGLTGPLLDGTHRYREIYFLGYLIATLAFLGFSLILELSPHSYGLLVTAVVVVGIGSFALLPAALELTVEVTHPMDPGTSCGFLWMSGMVLGIVLLLGSDGLRDPVTGDMSGAVWMMMGVLAVGAVVSGLLIQPFPPVYKRLQQEGENLQKNQNGNTEIYTEN